MPMNRTISSCRWYASNCFAYYLLGCEPTCGYLALMCVVAFFFIWPSEDKMLYERAIDEPKQEETTKN